ncbi:MAG: hypothetical protein WCZ18_11845 [Ottowia sp.]|nr:hypothetical protein [Ottowia sp.]
MAHVLRGPGMTCGGCIKQIICLLFLETDAGRAHDLRAARKQFANVRAEPGETG